MIRRTPSTALIVPIFRFRSARHRTGIVSSHPPKQLLKLLDYRRNRNIAYFAGRPNNDLHGPFGNLLSHSDSKRDTDQIGILEFHSGALVAVIEHHVEAGTLQPLGNVLGGRFHGFILPVHRSYDDLKRRNRWRQPESVLVIR